MDECMLFTGIFFCNLFQVNFSHAQTSNVSRLLYCGYFVYFMLQCDVTNESNPLPELQEVSPTSDWVKACVNHVFVSDIDNSQDSDLSLEKFENVCD